MWNQIGALAWAQFRISRNHLPRTGFGTVVAWFFLSIWYGMFVSAAVLLAWRLPTRPLPQIEHWLPAGLLGVFLFWELVPLFTLSSGWSLQLKRLQIYPIPDNALFMLETVLRVTSTPEMIILLCGAAIGLLPHPALPAGGGFAVFLIVPFCLFLQMAVRDVILHAFERNRFRELFAAIMLSLSVLPQIVLRSHYGPAIGPYILAAASNRLAPWHAAAAIGLGQGHALDLLLIVTWSVGALLLARWVFNWSLVSEEAVRAGGASVRQQERGFLRLGASVTKLLRDPLGALVERELRTLVRAPRFRVIFGMSCLLGILFFVPAILRGDPSAGFMRNNLLPMLNVYGLLLLSDALLLNAFGLDRGAAQLYFVTPVPFATVLRAKNITAVLLIALQNAIVLPIALLARVPLTVASLVAGVLTSAVVTIFLLAAGNFSSLMNPKPMDPKQTFKKQAGARMQLWMLGCTLGLFLLIGFAYLARYAAGDRNWVLFTVLGTEALVGLLVYRFGFETAVARGQENREKIVSTLSVDASPVSQG